jgi:preprotein translocase subunit SecY
MSWELRQRLAFTLGALLVYRLGSDIPMPGLDFDILEQIVRSPASGILGSFNAFTGGGILGIAIFALIVLGAFLDTAFLLDPEETARTLNRHGGTIPKVAAGEPTAEHDWGRLPGGGVSHA